MPPGGGIHAIRFGHGSGLLAAVLDRDADGGLIRKAGVMAVVLRGGTVRADDPISISLPPEPYHLLERV